MEANNPATPWSGKSGWLVMAIGGAGMLGWILEQPWLVTVIPGGAPMAFNTAVALFLLGGGLLALHDSRPGPGRVAGVFVTLIGGVTLCQFPLGRDLGVDQLLWAQDIMMATSAPGRMAPNTAVAFVASGLALSLAMARRPRLKTISVLVIVVLVAAVLALFGYTFDLQTAFSWGNYTGMALPTAGAFLLVGATLLSWVQQSLDFHSKVALRSRLFFIAAGVTVVTVGAAALVSNRSQQKAVRRMTITEEAIAALYRREIRITGMESIMRGYLVTGQERFSTAFAEADAEIAAELRPAKALITDDPVRVANLGRLDALIQAKLQFMRTALSAAKAGRFDQAADMIRNGPGPAIMQQIHDQIRRITDEERRMLALSTNETNRLAVQTDRVILLGNILAAMLFVTALRRTRRADRARATAETELREVLAREKSAHEEAKKAKAYFRALFESGPGLYLVLSPAKFEIVGASEAYLRGTNTTRDELIGKHLFDMFPDDPDDPIADGVRNLRASLERVKQLNAVDVMAVQRYPIRRPAAAGGGFEERYWSPVNSPVVGPDGELAYIIHQVEDVTEFIHLKEQGEAGGERGPTLEHRAERMKTEIVLRSQELQRLNQKLRESEERFRAAFDHAGIGMALVDPEGRWLQVNQALQTLLGYSEPELITRTFQDITHPEDLQADLANVHDLLAGRRRHYQIEKRYIHREGRIVYVRLTVSLVRDADGTPLHFIAQVEDITARNQIQQALEASQRQLVEVFRAMAEGLVLQDRLGNIIECNAAAESILGLSRAQLLGLTSHDPRWQVFNEDGSPCPAEQHPTVITRMTRQSQRGIIMGVRKADGTLRWVSVNSEAILEEDGNLRAVVCSFTDITDRKQAAEALAESEERTRLFAEHAPASVAMFDREMRYLVHSAKWLKDYGLEGREIIGRSHYEIFPEIGENWKEIHRRCMAGTTEINEADPFERVDGHRQWLSWRVQPWRNAAGEIGGIVMFTEDITHRKELEQSLAAARDQALAASKMKSEFLANVSHEIRTPMNGVLGMADLLMDTRLTEDQQQMARVIQSSAQNLLKLIDDLLDFSKIEAGKFSITTDVFSLTEQVDQALALMAPRAVSGQVSLESDLPADLPVRLLGDAGRIQQVLVNLLGNAVKFTEKGGVTVAVRPLTPSGSGSYAFRIEVRDTGIGISDEQKARLFQPFVQADGSTTRRFGGTGLGLAISRQLIELMNGRIGCESEPARGSVFWFELELPFAVAPATLRKTASLAPQIQSGARILVAEDQQANQLVMRLLLTKLGLDHTIVGDGQAVIEKLSAEEYALILMDCQMPRIDGYEATRLIRAGAAGPDRQATPIVALTAHAMASDRERCLEAGMDDYLSKPIRLDALQGILLRLAIGFVPAAEPVPPPPASATVATVLDPAQLAQLRSLPGRSRSSLLEELAEMALQEVPATLVQLRGHLERKATKDTAMTAHRLAGAAANLGATGLRTVLIDIEQAAEAADWSKTLGRLADLDQEWSMVQQALNDLLPKNPS